MVMKNSVYLASDRDLKCFTKDSIIKFFETGMYCVFIRLNTV